ncbi:hypothetical protein L1887_36307 [Cichorium endivia]|nr:hypothetical protein L1887_36307 [Cichorium endivia]
MKILTWKSDIKLEELNHSNLGKLFGYCVTKQELLCVYEFIPNKSLDGLLYEEPGTTSLSWVARLNIAIGAAEDLIYLHKRKQPAHSQFKTNLIWVDMDFNARLLDLDFDYASDMFPIDPYYAAPEWFRHRADTFDGRREWQPSVDGIFFFKRKIF